MVHLINRQHSFDKWSRIKYPNLSISPAHFKQRLASRRAPRSLKVVCLMSSKLFVSGGQLC